MPGTGADLTQSQRLRGPVRKGRHRMAWTLGAHSAGPGDGVGVPVEPPLPVQGPGSISPHRATLLDCFHLRCLVLREVSVCVTTRTESADGTGRHVAVAALRTHAPPSSEGREPAGSGH